MHENPLLRTCYQHHLPFSLTLARHGTLLCTSLWYVANALVVTWLTTQVLGYWGWPFSWIKRLREDISTFSRACTLFLQRFLSIYINFFFVRVSWSYSASLHQLCFSKKCVLQQLTRNALNVGTLFSNFKTNKSRTYSIVLEHKNYVRTLNWWVLEELHGCLIFFN